MDPWHPPRPRESDPSTSQWIHSLLMTGHPRRSPHLLTWRRGRPEERPMDGRWCCNRRSYHPEAVQAFYSRFLGWSTAYLYCYSRSGHDWDLSHEPFCSRAPASTRSGGVAVYNPEFSNTHTPHMVSVGGSRPVAGRCQRLCPYSADPGSLLGQGFLWVGGTTDAVVYPKGTH